MTPFQSECTNKLNQLKPHATFLSIHQYTNVKNHKLANWNLVFHISYPNALKKSIKILQTTPLSLFGKPYSIATAKLAKELLLHSFSLSLQGLNYSPSEDSYDTVAGADNKPIPGIKLHKQQDLLHLFGFVVSSSILDWGIIKEVEHQELTLAKKDWTSLTPLSRWVQFRLQPGRFNQINVNKLTITDQEVIRQYN